MADGSLVLDDPHAVHSLRTEGADPLTGQVRWDPTHSVWNGGMLLLAVVLGPLTISPGTIGIFVLTTGTTLLLGHSVGLHRRLIHRSFACPVWLEAVLVWFATVVGMDGPLSMMRIHDTRDWAQRQAACHGYFGHQGSMLGDGWRQLHCRLKLERPPAFDPPPEVARNGLYRGLERTWMLQQAPVAAVLYLGGGWPWVVWGVAVRVAASVTGHWFVGHLAHRRGPQTWLVAGAGVQAHDVPWAAIPTMGEAWHNNHHAYPGSAKMGHGPGQPDPGYWLIRLLEIAGLAWDVRTPETLPFRPALVHMVWSRG
jgi:stearoyl-CoA desaturase (delta-9 desaturase)